MRKITFAFLILSPLLLFAQNNNLPDIELVSFASGFNQPVGIEHAGDSRLFVVEQTGKIKILNTDGTSKSHFLNLSDKISTAGFEQGLLGLAFHPDYEDNGYFYVHYTNLDGNSRISRFSVNPNNPSKALPSSEVIMFENDDPFRNHNSGQMKFGPDGYLYFAIGDGGSGGDPFNNGQDPGTSFGKLMRIDPTDDGGYDIPASNPFVGVEGYLGEIWATGLRNPWRFSFDMLTGDLWIPDVGQNTWEEVNYTPAGISGQNYGWSCREGLHFFKADCDDNGTPFTDPIAEYMHSEDPAFPCSGSITGGYVYRGDEYPDMYGKYFYTDFCTGVIRTTWWDGSAWVTAELGNFTPFAYSTFGEDINGELYLVDKTAGRIYRFTDGGGGALAYIPEPVYSLAVGKEHQLRADGDYVDENMVDFDEIVIQSINNPSLISVNISPDQFLLSPNPNHGEFTIHLNADQPGIYNVSITDIMGHAVLSAKKEVQKGINEWRFNSSTFSNGMYLVQVHSPLSRSTLKFVVE